MILLIFVTIYFFRKFRTLAESKGYPGTRWGVYGSLVYLGVAFSVQFLMGLLYELGVIDLDLGSTGASFVVAIIGYGIGALAAHLLFKKLESKEDVSFYDIEDFGKED